MTTRSLMMASLLLVSGVLAALPTDADAQRRGRARTPGSAPAHSESIDFSALYGWMWGGSVDLRYQGSGGTLRVGSGESWTFALDVPVDEATWAELQYTRQNSQLDLDRFGSKTSLTNMTVNYWQIGGVRGLPRGNVIPYVSGSLGVTHYAPSQSSTTIDDDTIALDSATRFSFIVGLGFKTFLGQSQRIGLRGAFRVLGTLYDSGAGFWFGSGGSGITISGSGIWQWDVSGGVTVRLGGL